MYSHHPRISFVLKRAPILPPTRGMAIAAACMIGCSICQGYDLMHLAVHTRTNDCKVFQL